MLGCVLRLHGGEACLGHDGEALELTPPSQCASFSRNDPLWNRCTVTHYHHPSWTDNGSFRAALDDVIIIPFVFVGLAASKVLRLSLIHI